MKRPQPGSRPAAAEAIRIGVSSCLLGNQVRYDGGHKRDGFLVETFGPYVDWIPVCPEFEMGLGVPRPTLRLQRADEGVRLVMPDTGGDYSEAMRRFARRRVAQLATADLCGYVLKKDSPSCGMERVKVYAANRMPSRDGRGLFAEALIACFPHLPVEEEGRLNDPALRENFVERVFAYHRLRRLFRERWTLGDLVAFHTRHKLQLMAHSPKSYSEMGRLVARAKGTPRAPLRARYEAEFMGALSTLATRRRHTNVLHHVLGYFTRRLDGDSRREQLSVIEDYRAGLVPLVVPLTLIRHYVRLFGVTYLEGQTYLEPHPKELMLRNHV
jgi:uncharacterized protein YbgA (DUF1722 family)/uncharacterized protein YbbK (DUF523 family)